MTQNVYVVLYSMVGYAREGAPIAKCAGAFLDHEKAVIACCAVGGKIVEFELDKLEPGYIEYSKALGFIE